MDVRRRLIAISNSYYNIGLEKARQRNLSGAIVCLNKALQLNKNHIEARNLLGLVYYEIGEIGEALVSWVISSNLEPEGNHALRFLDRLQRKENKLEVYEQNIIKYNQALSQAAHDNKDLAILQLARVLDTHPNYVRAALLISLLHLDKEDYEKSRKYLEMVLKTDRANPKAIEYMGIIQDQLLAREKTKHKSGRDKETVAGTYTGFSGWQTALNMGIGLLIGMATVLFIYMPTTTARLHDAHNKEMIMVEEQLNEAIVQVDQLEELTEQMEASINQYREMENTGLESATFTYVQYQLLLGMLKAFYDKDYSLVARYYADFDETRINDIDDGSGISVRDLYEPIRVKMAEEGHVLLLQPGDAAFAAGDFETAMAYYNRSLKLRADYTPAMYKKALTFKAMGNEEEANNLFGEIIVNYPKSKEAELAKNQRGY